MADIPTVTLDPMTEGDTWPGIATIGPVTFNTLPPDNDATTVRCHWRKAGFSSAYLKLGNDVNADFPIVIDVPSTWEFSIAAIPYADFPLTKGEWVGDLEVTDSAGVRITICKFIQVVNEQITV